jgi:hypothetical protein
MRTIRMLVVSAAALLLLGSCAFRGTATLFIYNQLSGSRRITSLYVYPTGSGYRGGSIIFEPLDYGEHKVQYLVEPGPTTVEAEINGGFETAYKTLVAEAEHVYWNVYITEGDIF